MATKPKPVLRPDFKELTELCEFHLDELVKDDEDDDTRHYIYEATMEAVFGKEIWEFINNLPER